MSLNKTTKQKTTEQQRLDAATYNFTPQGFTGLVRDWIAFGTDPDDDVDGDVKEMAEWLAERDHVLESKIERKYVDRYAVREGHLELALVRLLRPEPHTEADLAFARGMLLRSVVNVSSSDLNQSENACLAADTVRLGALALQFGRVNRATFHEDGERPETDTDHTVMLGLVAASLAEKLRPMRVWSQSKREPSERVYLHSINGLSTARIAEFAVVHDLVEAYAGDTNSFGISAEGRDEKEVREAAALKRIRAEFQCFAWIDQTITAFELQVEPEARWVKYLDKALPKITHILNHGATMQRRGITSVAMMETVHKQIEALAKKYPEFPDVHALLGALAGKLEAVVDSNAPSARTGFEGVRTSGLAPTFGTLTDADAMVLKAALTPTTPQPRRCQECLNMSPCGCWP
jgi:putative hydrolase of HD superfamily